MVPIAVRAAALSAALAAVGACATWQKPLSTAARERDKTRVAYLNTQKALIQTALGNAGDDGLLVLLPVDGRPSPTIWVGRNAETIMGRELAVWTRDRQQYRSDCLYVPPQGLGLAPQVLDCTGLANQVTQLANLVSNLSSMGETLTSLRQALSNVEARVDRVDKGLSDAVRTIRAELDRFSSDLTALRGGQREAGLQINELQKAVAPLSVLVPDQEDKLRLLRSHVDSLAKSFGENLKAVDENNAALQNLVGSVQKLSSDLRSSLDELRRKIEAIK